MAIDVCEITTSNGLIIAVVLLSSDLVAGWKFAFLLNLKIKSSRMMKTITATPMTLPAIDPLAIEFPPPTDCAETGNCVTSGLVVVVTVVVAAVVVVFFVVVSVVVTTVVVATITLHRLPDWEYPELHEHVFVPGPVFWQF